MNSKLLVRSLWNLFALCVVASLLSACGVGNDSRQRPQAYSYYPNGYGLSGTYRAPSSSFSNPTPVQAGGTQTSASPTPTGTTAPNYSNSIPVLAYTISGKGYSSATVTARVNRVLRVKFVPGVQKGTIKTAQGQVFKPEYTKLAVYLSMGSQIEPTEMLGNGLGGGGPQESRIIDFSYSLKTTCPTSQPGCRETVTIKIDKPNNDFYCANTGQYCPHTHVPVDHPWNGTLYIQTDDTEAL